MTMTKQSSTTTAAIRICDTTSTSPSHEEKATLKVFDLSLMNNDEGERRIQEDNDDHSTSVASSSSSSPIPPLEALTTCSTATDDDSASVSSVSTQGSLQTRRSLFSRYWKKTGQDPPKYLSRLSAAEAASAVADEDSTSTSSTCAATETNKNYYGGSNRFLSTPPEDEEVLDVQVPSMALTTRLAAPAAPTPKRRTVLPSGAFIKPSSSLSSLYAAAAQQPSSCRKTQSFPHLAWNKHPSASCLRASRFSPHKNSNNGNHAKCLTRATSCGSTASIGSTSSTASSVRFDMDAVAVRHFEPPKERYAERGWSEYFC